MAFQNETLDRMQERGRALIGSFGDCVDRFERGNPFTGPSSHFHLKTRLMLDRRRRAVGCAERAVAECIGDESFRFFAVSCG